MNELINVHIETKDGINVVSSRVIAEQLGKRHDNIKRDLAKILKESHSSDLSNEIILSNYENRGMLREEYLLTKDGFTLYMFNIQGYNDFKIAYINEFNRMEKALQERNTHQLTKEQELQLRVLNGDSMSRTIALAEYKEFIEAPLKEEITTLQAFTDVITCTDTCISMKEFADLSFNLYHMGRNKLMQTLRIMSILTRNNIPYQRFIKCGYFEVEEVSRNNKIVTVTRVTPKGQKYLCKQLNKHLQTENNIMQNVTIRHEDPKVLQEKYTTITNKYII